jgi:protein N-lysine methyltransferase METTL21D
LDWGNKEHIKAVEPPFDYIIGTDIVSLIMQCLESSEICLSNNKSYLISGHASFHSACHLTIFAYYLVHYLASVYCHGKYIATHVTLS